MQSAKLLSIVGFLLAAIGMLLISLSARRLPEARRNSGVLSRARWASIRTLRTEYTGNGLTMYRVGAVTTVLGVLTALSRYLFPR